MAIPSKIGFDPARLQVQLLNTGLQNKDQQLYQLLFLMINAMEKLKDVSNANASIPSPPLGGGGNTTIINELGISQLLYSDYAQDEQLMFPSLSVVNTGGGGTGGNAGTWNLISTFTLTGQTSKDFIDLGQYSDIRVILRNVTLSVSAEIRMRVSWDNGVTFLASSGDYIAVSGAGAESAQSELVFYFGSATTGRSGEILINGWNSNGPKVSRANFFSSDNYNLRIIPQLNPLNAIRIFNTLGSATMTGTVYVLGRFTGGSGGSGSEGLQGPQGIPGISGRDGYTIPSFDGIDGFDSFIPGPIGPIGNTGPQGIQGIQGNTGTAGINGINGKDGIIGPQGLDGIVDEFSNIYLLNQSTQLVPLNHHTSHETGGSDVITSIDGSVISSGSVNDARLSSNVALKNAVNIFTANQEIVKSLPFLTLMDTSQPVDSRRFRIADASQNIYIQALNDAETISSGFVAFSRLGQIFERSRTIPIGEWANVPFNAANFFADSPMTWTVGAPAVITNKYTLIGRTMLWSFYIAWFAGSNVLGGTTGTNLRMAIPGGFTSTGAFSQSPAISIINGVLVVGGYIVIADAATLVIQKNDQTNMVIGSAPGIVMTMMLEVT